MIKNDTIKKCMKFIKKEKITLLVENIFQKLQDNILFHVILFSIYYFLFT